jgi:hypothetical protein
MSDFKSRFEKLEKEYRFREWFHFQRYFESLNYEQLVYFARYGFCEDPQPHPLPLGSSKLDGLDRKRLLELWQENERWGEMFDRRKAEDQKFFCVHGYWPEQACGTECAGSTEREDDIQDDFGGNNVFPKGTQ